MRIGILGAGPAGLGAAYSLCKKGYKPTVLDSSAMVGGQIANAPLAGLPLEIFYHYSFNNYHYLFDLLKELNLDSDLFWKPGSMGYYYNGIFYPFGRIPDLIKFKPLSWPGKIKFVISLFQILAIRNPKSIEGISAQEWFAGRGYEEVWDIVWKPLFSSKFESKSPTIAMTWLWKKVNMRVASRSTGGSEVLGYMKGSFAKMAESIESHTKNAGAVYFLNERINTITFTDGVYRVKTDKNEHQFDSIISTFPAPVLSELISWPIEFKKHLRQYKFMAGIVMRIVMESPISNHWWSNITDPSLPFVAIIEHSNLTGTEIYNGKNVVYLSRYLSAENPLFKESNDTIRKLYLEGLKKVEPTFHEDQILGDDIFRSAYAQPIIEKNYQKPNYETPFEKFFWTSPHHIYPVDRGVSQSMENANEIVNTYF